MIEILIGIIFILLIVIWGIVSRMFNIESSLKDRIFYLNYKINRKMDN